MKTVTQVIGQTVTGVKVDFLDTIIKEGTCKEVAFHVRSK